MKKPDLTASEERTQAIASRAGLSVDEWRNAVQGRFIGTTTQKAIVAEIDQMLSEERNKFETIPDDKFSQHKARIAAIKEVRAILARTELP